MERDIPAFSSISTLLAALTLVLGGAVVLSGRRRKAYLAFIGLCANLFLWHLFCIYRSSTALAYLALGCLCFVPVSLLAFLRTWLGENRSQESGILLGVPRSVWVLLGAEEAALLYAYTQRAYPHSFWAHVPSLIRVLTLVGLYAALSPLLHAYRRSMSRVEKRRLLYLLGVGAITVTAAAIDHLPSPYGSGGPATGSLLTIVYLYFLQQTLFLDRLLDINELLAKVVVLSAFVLLLSAILTLMTLIGVEQKQVVTLVAFVILILYEPLRNLLEAQVHKWTARERYELKQHLGELRNALTNIIDLREAVRKVLSLLEETQRMTHASVYLVDADGAGYELQGHFGPRPVERLDAAARRPLLWRLLATRQPVTLEQLERERQSLAATGGATAELENLDAIGRTLLELHAGVVIGIFASTLERKETERQGMPWPAEEEPWVPGETLLGLLCIKDDRIPDPFAPDELERLASVASQLGITVQNSKLYERMKERDRLAALGEMAAGLAHEIRNPLGAIKGAAELVAPRPGEKLPEDAADFLQIIVEETRRLNRVVSQFLDYARPLRGELVLVDVNEVVRRTLLLLPQEARGGQNPPAEIQLALMPDLPPVRGDPEQLRQVFLNLALNALQALEAGPCAPGESPRLTISTAQRRGRNGMQVEVRFADNGPGIAPSTRKSLFIPFFTTRERGTGLGLPISQRIVEHHGGTIEVRSRLGQGATFTVVLPVEEAPPTR
ncbi:MAG: ATP-binding protein [Myxococcales bacterium]|nr:ATP-binding protein [Myxococcota bacterium]MDW8281013.1 ATP-binding protein [Myxococcales bacterium]